MHSKSDNMEVMTYDKLDENIGERYQIGLETQIRGNDFIFYCVNLLHYQCQK